MLNEQANARGYFKALKHPAHKCFGLMALIFFSNICEKLATFVKWTTTIHLGKQSQQLSQRDIILLVSLWGRVFIFDCLRGSGRMRITAAMQGRGQTRIAGCWSPRMCWGRGRIAAYLRSRGRTRIAGCWSPIKRPNKNKCRRRTRMDISLLGWGQTRKKE